MTHQEVPVTAAEIGGAGPVDSVGRPLGVAAVAGFQPRRRRAAGAFRRAGCAFRPARQHSCDSATMPYVNRQIISQDSMVDFKLMSAQACRGHQPAEQHRTCNAERDNAS